jgi:hypothetical protein
VAGEAEAQLHLLDFVGCSVAKRFDEYDIVGRPPFAILPSRCAAIDCAVTVARASGTTTSNGRSSHFGWGMPTTTASATPGHPMARFSTSIELIHSPPDLMTSLGAIGEANDIVLVKDGNVAAVEPAILKQGFFFTCLNDKRLLGHRHSSHRTELGSGR